MKVYHASPVLFDEFAMQSGGLHFGGKHSALQAIERHILGNESDEFYLYTVELDTAACVESYDARDAISWDWERNATGCDVLRYTNRYEQDISPSYAVFDLSKIKIIKTEKKRLKQFEIETGFGYDMHIG